MNISSIDQVKNLSGIAVADISPLETGVISLDDRFRDAFVSAAVETEVNHNDIVTRSKDPGLLSDSGKLLALQIDLGNYKQQMEVTSALARKGVAVAETLLRA